MPIETAASIREFFQASVADAMKNQRVDASPEATAYIASVLEEFVRPESSASLAETLDHSLTLLLDQALQSPPSDRFEKLRSLGDGTLYVSGFFGDHLQRRGVDDALVRTIGGFAYRSAGAMVRSETGMLAVVYRELAERFARFVEVLAEVAESTAIAGAKTSSGMLKLYERWLRTGSDRIGRALAAEGFMPLAKAGAA